jgi:hypothetical protein
MEIKSSFYNIFLISLIFICLILIIFQNSFLYTGNVTQDSAVANVSINKYLSISFSSNLSEGIYFGTIYSLPSIDTNASRNYVEPTNITHYYINVSNDSNTLVDFCIKASGDMLNSASDAIGLANETYSNSISTNSSVPLQSSKVSLTTSYTKSGEEIMVGGINYYRFWLSIPSGQPSGDYNNTLSFKAIESGASC